MKMWWRCLSCAIVNIWPEESHSHNVHHIHKSLLCDNAPPKWIKNGRTLWSHQRFVPYMAAFHSLKASMSDQPLPKCSLLHHRLFNFLRAHWDFSTLEALPLMQTQAKSIKSLQLLYGKAWARCTEVCFFIDQGKTLRSRQIKRCAMTFLL